eukprot:TRINITY_DN25900_c0_g1_i2.p4 TRINITY_DN25900_c0_g1~~TRINITY_DN25900_c0_g1_i2.p4  ORF type:complete len:101 (+),score=6.70 TRINITY_DN25900_c0_g1_i2:497-799(+)
MACPTPDRHNFELRFSHIQAQVLQNIVPRATNTFALLQEVELMGHTLGQENSKEASHYINGLNLTICFLSKKNQLRKYICLLYTSPSPRDLSTSRMPSSA